MLGVTFADLAYRYRQFLIAVVGAGLVLAMGLLLAGLAGGFRAEIVQTVGSVGAQRWIMTNNANGRVAAVGVFPQSDLAVIARTPGVVRANALAVIPQQVARTGGQVDTVNVIGVQRGGLGDPTVVTGRSLSGNGEIVADESLGTKPGQVIVVGATRFHVVGTVNGSTLLGGTANVYTTLSDAQSLALGKRPLITAVVTQGVPASVPSGLTSMSPDAVEQSTLNQMASAVSSVNNSKFLMWLVAAIIIAALLYVSALQRVRDFAVLKALGSSSTLLFVSLALQAVLVTLAAAAFGMIICNFMSGLFSQPIDIPVSAFATLPVVAVVVGLLSSLVALRRATGADPAAAFGG